MMYMYIACVYWQRTSRTISLAHDRHASYTFTKHAHYKGARYVGMWRKGLLHGQ